MRKTAEGTKADQYAQRKEKERKRQASMSERGRDIGEGFPTCTDVALREECEKSFKRFCEVCFPSRFALGWSQDHLDVIDQIERSVKDGYLFALAMPRGHGKTTIACCAVLWAVLCGYRRYVLLIGASDKAARKLLVGIKTDLEKNDVMLSLWPEACHPIRMLEGKGNKATGQLCNGKRTYIEWKGPRIVLADIEGSACSSSVIEVVGITSGFRGMQHTTPSGEVIRLDLFVLDDPQTNKSAISEAAIAQRMEVITGGVLGLGGPDKTLAGFALVTVIKSGDVADQLLDVDKFPDWHGKRVGLMRAWPTDTKKWEHYGVLRAESLKAGEGIKFATDYYAANRQAMDAGGDPAWPARYYPHELSAIQHAYNLRLKMPETFDAEYQNEPIVRTSDIEVLTVDQIEAKVSGYARGVLPAEVDTITAFIDVQGQLLYWAIVGWRSADFSGWCLDYGSWPEQTARHYQLRTVSQTLSKKYKSHGLEARIRAGLFDLVDYISQRTFSDGGNRSGRVQVIGIDAAWGPCSKIVHSVTVEHPRAAWLMACYGRGLGPTDRPMQDWTAKKGERKGHNWLVRPSEGGGRHCVIDVNYWKSFLHARLNVPLGDSGCFSLYTPELRTEHRMIAEHLRAEEVTTVSANGRSVEIWKLPPRKPDNHLADCLTNATVMASICGATLREAGMSDPTPRRPTNRPPTRLIA